MAIYKNYEITKNILPKGLIYVNDQCIYHPDLYQIRALRDFRGVKAGDLGGWIENSENLAHDYCWIFPGAMVFGGAKVSDYAMVADNAIVHEDSIVFDNAKIKGSAVVGEKSLIYDYAEVYDNAVISKAKIEGSAKVYGNASVDNSIVQGNAQICGNAEVIVFSTISDNAYCQDAKIRNSRIKGNAKILNANRINVTTISGHAEINGKNVALNYVEIEDDALIKENSDFLAINGVASIYDYPGEPAVINFYKNRDNGISVKHGSFTGTVKDLLEILEDQDNPDKLVDFYKSAIELAKMRIIGDKI